MTLSNDVIDASYDVSVSFQKGFAFFFLYVIYKKKLNVCVI
jgi:hypothetical protein